MRYPADNYDLSGLITACSKMTPAGLTYNVVGVDNEDRCANGGGHDCVEDQILNHNAGVFLFCPMPRDGEERGLADGAAITTPHQNCHVS